MRAAVKHITLPANKRAICISDIHGHLELFEKLLAKVAFSNDDTLILLGDLFLKGPRPLETLCRIMDLSQNPNVHILRGNCDYSKWAGGYTLSAEQDAWLEALPHIIDAGDYVFVHGGLPSERLDELEAWPCMKNDAFMEQEKTFSNWVLAGHWPVVNYCRGIPSNNPIINEERRIIAIDGGCAVKDSGQLNAFIIQNGSFSFESADMLPTVTVKAPQEASGGFNIVWPERFVDVIERGDEFSLVRHTLTGREITLPNAFLWKDGGQYCGCRNGTDYFLPVSAGETLSLVRGFSDRMLCKKNGTVGWVWL